MLNALYEKIEAVLHTLDIGGEQSRAFAGEIDLLKDVLGYPQPVQDDWDELDRRRILAEKLRRLAVASEGILIPLPTNPVAQWFDGTYQDTTIDMQLDEFDVGQLLKFIVDVGINLEAVNKGDFIKVMLHEQSPDYPSTSVQLSLSGEDGQLWIRPAGYGEKCAPDGKGSPVGMEIWQGKLRLIAFTDINSEEPQIIDLETAKESCRNEYSQKDASYGVAATYLLAEGRRIFTGPMTGGLWNARGMDASRKHDNKAAYEFLIQFGDQYAQSLTVDQKTDWQTIKDQAAALLKTSKADHPSP